MECTRVAKLVMQLLDDGAASLPVNPYSNVTSLYNALPPLLPQYNLLGFGRMRKIDLGESGGVSLILETRKKIILVIGQNLWFGVMSMHAT